MATKSRSGINVNARVPRELWAQVRDKADKAGQKLQYVVAQALREWLASK